LINHAGIVLVDCGKSLIYHNTPDYKNQFGGSIQIEELSNWLSDKVITRTLRTNVSPERIKSVTDELKNKPYNFLNFNCEHYLSAMVDDKHTSGQLKNWVIGLSLLAITLKYR
jgi:hypothetical protein